MSFISNALHITTFMLTQFNLCTRRNRSKRAPGLQERLPTTAIMFNTYFLPSKAVQSDIENGYLTVGSKVRVADDVHWCIRHPALRQKKTRDADSKHVDKYE